MDGNSHICIVCGSKSELICQRCFENYCSDACQKKDWPRHKYVCTAMPKLVNTQYKLKAAPNASAFTNMSPVSSELQILDLVDNAAKLGKPEEPKLISLWRQHLAPPENEFFECRVTYIEMDGSIWVMDLANTERLERLNDNMARCAQNSSPYSFKDLIVGDLVGVGIENKVCRGEVISLDAEAEEAKIRFIDYGHITCGPAANLWPAVSRMSEYKAFAFRVKLPTNTGVQINMNLTLRLLGKKTADGVELVQLRSKLVIPLNLPVQMLAINPEVTVVKVFESSAERKEPQVALLRMRAMENLNAELNKSLDEKSSLPLNGPFPDAMHTFFVAASTKEGYRRAFLLDFLEKPTTYLVYEMDEGRISITKEVRRLPSELRGHPLRVFAATLVEGQPGMLQNELEKCGRDLTIKFNLDNMLDKNNLRAASATLLASNEMVCKLHINTFQGPVADLNIKYWREPILNDSLVYITHVVGYNEVCISSVQAKEYTKILKYLDEKCPPFGDSSDIPIGCIVLVACSKIGYFRGEVIDVTNGYYSVYNIDSGTEHEVSAKALRMPCRFIENMPVYMVRCKLKIICDIPKNAVPQNSQALQLLKTLCAQEEELAIEFTGPQPQIVDLVSLSEEPRSLVQRLLPLIFAPTPKDVPLKLSGSPTAAEPRPTTPLVITPSKQVQKKSDEFPPLPPSPPPSGGSVITPASYMAFEETKTIDRYYFDDMPRNLVPLGKRIDVLILTVMDLCESGYIWTCAFLSEKVAANFQNSLNFVGSIGSCAHNFVPGFVPGVGEMCIAIFSGDKIWYRGVCLEVLDKHVRIFYCDYGNIEVVPLDGIKPFSSDLLQSVYATKCFINGFNKSKNFKILAEYLNTKQRILCSVDEGPEPNSRLITIPHMETLLTQEVA